MAAIDALPKSLCVMGTSVVPFRSYGQALECIEAAIVAGRKTLCVAVNPEKVCRALHNPELLQVLGRAEIGICDGIGIALAVRILYGHWITRCTGVDLFLELLRAAARKQWRVFLLGASEESNAAACERLGARFPGLQIAGRHHGYFREPGPVVRRINASRAHLLFVAMGSPRQELWIAQQRDAIAAPFCMGVGGALDVVSGNVRRAPSLCRRSGTEFLYRLLTDPRRLRRQLVLPLFVFRLLSHALRRNGAVA